MIVEDLLSKDVSKENIYYKNWLYKLGDFVIGILFGLFIYFLLANFGLIFTSNTYVIPVVVLLTMVLVTFLFKIGRRFIAVGIVSTVLIPPLLLFGSCFLGIY